MTKYYQTYEDHIQCLLCPHNCRIKEEKTGICGVRKNSGKKIQLLTYGLISGYSLDPVEKKPLYHFFPGKSILSIGSYGCNMKCDFCQNWNISQRSADKFAHENSPEEIVSSAMSYDDNIGIAFTYNEPVIWFEFIKDIAIMIKEKGLHTVLVSNGYVNRSPLSEIIGFTDAFNIDLKAFNGEFYRRLTGAEIEPVKETLKQIVKAGRHLEITTLIIPGKNDDLREMDLETKWIADELGTETPFHLSRYYPMYKRDDTATPQSTLDRLYETASANLRNVYIGNAQTALGQDTRCKCGAVVTMRSGYQTRFINLDNNGKCRLCGETVYRHFTSRQILR